MNFDSLIKKLNIHMKSQYYIKIMHKINNRYINNSKLIEIYIK